MTAKKLRILLVESSSADAQHTLNKLSQAGYELEHRRVDSAKGMKAALSREQFDVVLCSYDPPGFGGLPALELMQNTGVNLPFLFLSHDLREETIIYTMQRGADDYIFKGSLNRLAPAIEHNLREAHIRQKHLVAQFELQENQTRLHAFIADLPGMAYQMQLRDDGTITFPYVSEGCQALLGITPQDLTHVSSLFEAMLHPEDFASYQRSMHTSARNLTFWNWEGRILTMPNNETKWINLRCSPRKIENGTQWEGIIFNITQSKLAELEIRRSKSQLRELSSHIQDVREQERICHRPRNTRRYGQHAHCHQTGYRLAEQPFGRQAGACREGQEHRETCGQMHRIRRQHFAQLTPQRVGHLRHRRRDRDGSGRIRAAYRHLLHLRA